MSDFDLEIHGGVREFYPGEELTGTLRWVLPKAPPSISLILFWHTEGKGSRDGGIFEEKKWDHPSAYGEENFSFKLPLAPHSFSGTFITLEWGIEAYTGKGDNHRYEKIFLSPTGREIKLGDPQSPPEKSSFFQQISRLFKSRR